MIVSWFLPSVSKLERFPFDSYPADSTGSERIFQFEGNPPLRELSPEQVSPLKDFPYIPVLVAIPNFGLTHFNYW